MRKSNGNITDSLLGPFCFLDGSEINKTSCLLADYIAGEQNYDFSGGGETGIYPDVLENLDF